MSLSVELHKQLGDFRLNVQFDAEDEQLALLGASGCGKSVTLKCIAGILTPDAGRITLNHRVLFDSVAHINLPPQVRRVGYLFQNYALFPHMNVRQNIALAAQNAADVPELLRRFQLENVASQKPCQLSGGQQQRVALARILASKPEAILLDEPFSALDSFLKSQLEWELAETLSPFPGTVLWVSHDQGEVFRNCPRVCVMDQGTSEPVSSREDLFRHPATVAAARLSDCETCVVAHVSNSAIFLPEWSVTLSGNKAIPQDFCAVGIRACHVSLWKPSMPNAIPCTVIRVVEDLLGGTALLRPEGATTGAPLLRMSVSNEISKAVVSGARITVSVAPEELLLLK